MKSNSWKSLACLSLFSLILLSACEPYVKGSWPASAPHDQETIVTISGAFLSPGSTTVYLNTAVAEICTPAYDPVECAQYSAPLGDWVKVIAPGGPIGPVDIKACSSNGCSETLDKIFAYTGDVGAVPQYAMAGGQVFPIDCAGGNHVRAGNLVVEDQPPQVPEVIVVAGRPIVIWNDSTPGAFLFDHDESAVEWSSGTHGFMQDVAFLDVNGDGADDHLYAAVTNKDDLNKRKDRLYRIDYPARTFTEVAVFDEQHKATTVAVTRDLDGDPTDNYLYVIVAGGNYDSKQEMNALYKDDLRILRIDSSDPGDLLFDEVPTDGLLPDEAVMTDVDVFDVNGDDLDDILLSVYWQLFGVPGEFGDPLPFSMHDRSEILINTWKAGDPYPGFTIDEDYALLETREAEVMGAAVGDLDGDALGLEDVVVFHRSKVSVYRNTGTALKLVTDPEPVHLETAHGSWNASYDAVPIDRDLDGKVDFLATAAGKPYILINETPDGGDITLVDFFTVLDEDRTYKGGEFYQAYSSVGVVAADLDRDGHEEVVYANKVEQNRLWRCEFAPGGDLLSVKDITADTPPAGGENSVHALTADLDSDGTADTVIAINMDYPPDIYGIDTVHGRLTDGHAMLALEPPPDRWGGFQGVLARLQGPEDTHPDLVIAGGTWGETEKKVNQIFFWNVDEGMFIYDAEALPAEARYTRGVAAGDLDGDGDTDLVFINEHHSMQVALNGGDGYFSGYRDIGETWYHSVALFRDTVTRQGVHDIIAGKLNTIHIYRNRGDGTFDLPDWVELDLGPLEQMEFLAPIALDGPAGSPRDDFFVAVQGGRNRLLLSTGIGFENYSDRLPGFVSDTRGACVLSLKGDGWDDVIACNNTSTTEVLGIKIYMNRRDGSGYLDDVTDAVLGETFNRDPVDHATVADVTGDGRPGIVLANDGQNRLLVPVW